MAQASLAGGPEVQNAARKVEVRPDLRLFAEATEMVDLRRMEIRSGDPAALGQVQHQKHK